MRVGCFVAEAALYCLIVWLFDCLIDGRAASGSICKAGGPRSRVAACSRLPTAHLVGSRVPRDRGRAGARPSRRCYEATRREGRAPARPWNSMRTRRGEGGRAGARPSRRRYEATTDATRREGRAPARPFAYLPWRVTRRKEVRHDDQNGSEAHPQAGSRDGKDVSGDTPKPILPPRPRLGDLRHPES